MVYFFQASLIAAFIAVLSVIFQALVKSEARVCKAADQSVDNLVTADWAAASRVATAVAPQANIAVSAELVVPVVLVVTSAAKATEAIVMQANTANDVIATIFFI